MKKICNHFWEIILPITNINKQKHRCMLCGQETERPIPILEIKNDV